MKYVQVARVSGHLGHSPHGECGLKSIVACVGMFYL